MFFVQDDNAQDDKGNHNLTKYFMIKGMFVTEFVNKASN